MKTRILLAALLLTTLTGCANVTVKATYQYPAPATVAK